MHANNNTSDLTLKGVYINNNNNTCYVNQSTRTMPSISTTTTTTTTTPSITTIQLAKNPPTTLRCATRRKLWRLGRKKSRLPTVRLGGQRQSQGSGSAMVRLFRRIRIRWLRLKKARVLKKLKEYYVCVLKDITERDKMLENNQQLLLMESSFAVPVMGIQFNSFR
ncbi:uncharacterized protein LOC143537017 [Bidens hawaiensis]|uniref:uncharacterized protein LOC143537017 n=1 Tax=Bidens hawaiensis TaxID=980011 RepID=UPI00404AC2FD